MGRSLSKFLREKREAAGLTQNQVAQKMGYKTPQFVSNWERGLSGPPMKALKRLAEMYGVSAEEMFKIILEQEIEATTKQLRKAFAKAR